MNAKGRFRCRECPRNYARERDRTAHEVAVHDRLPPGMCPRCRDSGFAYRSKCLVVSDYGERGEVVVPVQTRMVNCDCERGQLNAVIEDLEAA